MVTYILFSTKLHTSAFFFHLRKDTENEISVDNKYINK